MDTFMCLEVVSPDRLSEGVRQLAMQELAAVAGGMADGRDWAPSDLLRELSFDLLLIEEQRRPVFLVWPKPVEGLDEVEQERVQSAIDSFGRRESDCIFYDGPHGFIEDGCVRDVRCEGTHFITTEEALTRAFSDETECEE